MKLKNLQIMLVIAAVFCAVGIFIGMAGGGAVDANHFSPPAWLKALDGLAGGPHLTARDLTRNGVAFQEPLALPGHGTLQFKVEPADDEVRRVAFRIAGRAGAMLEIRYMPLPGQKLHGEGVEAQGWPNDEDGKPNFVVYDGGGTLLFRNVGSSTVRIYLED